MVLIGTVGHRTDESWNVNDVRHMPKTLKFWKSMKILVVPRKVAEILASRTLAS